MVDYVEIESIKEQLIRLFRPDTLFLFGSQASGSASNNSDIDLCIIVSTDKVFTDKKRTNTPPASLPTESTAIANEQECKTEIFKVTEQISPVNKCVYCKKIAAEEIPVDVIIGSGELHYCSETCKNETKKYIEAVNKHKGLFLGLTLGSTLAMVLVNGIIIGFNLRTQLMTSTTSMAVIVIGIAIIIFPFSTPQTVQWLGIKKAKTVARILGLLLIVLGFSFPLSLIKL